MKRRKWGHERRNLHKEHRGRQSSFVARVHENRENQTGRAGAHPNRRFGWRARAHPSLDSERGARHARGHPRVCDRCVLRLMELGGCARCGHPPTQATVAESESRRYRWRCLLRYSVRNSSHLWTQGLGSATLTRLSRALWSKKMRKVVPHKYPWRRLMLQTMLPALKRAVSSGAQTRE